MNRHTERILHRGHQEQDSHNKKSSGIPGFQKTAEPWHAASCLLQAGKACRPWAGCPGWLLCWEQDGQPPVRRLQSPGPGPCQVLGERVSSAGPKSRASGLFLKSFQEEGKAAPELDPLPLTTEFLEPATCQLYSGGKWHSVQSPQQCPHTLVPDKRPSAQSHST